LNKFKYLKEFMEDSSLAILFEFFIQIIIESVEKSEKYGAAEQIWRQSQLKSQLALLSELGGHIRFDLPRCPRMVPMLHSEPSPLSPLPYIPPAPSLDLCRCCPTSQDEAIRVSSRTGVSSACPVVHVPGRISARGCP
jgi:hypothetical protein